MKNNEKTEKQRKTMKNKEKLKKIGKTMKNKEKQRKQCFFVCHGVWLMVGY